MIEDRGWKPLPRGKIRGWKPLERRSNKKGAPERPLFSSVCSPPERTGVS
jgi:hypothetical protein